MLVRAVPYVLVWLSFVLLLVDVTPMRVAIAVLAVCAALVSRIALERRALAVAAAVVAVGGLVALGVTAASLDSLGRSVLGGAGGVIAVYCLMRAMRG